MFAGIGALNIFRYCDHKTCYGACVFQFLALPFSDTFIRGMYIHIYVHSLVVHDLLLCCELNVRIAVFCSKQCKYAM